MRTAEIVAASLSLIVVGCGSHEVTNTSGALSRTQLSSLAQNDAGPGTGLDPATAQIIVRAVCDQSAVLTEVRDQASYYEAIWGITQVQWPDRTLHPAPAKWARLDRAEPQASTTTCGIYQY
jgi:hypothetical protein